MRNTLSILFLTISFASIGQTTKPLGSTNPLDNNRVVGSIQVDSAVKFQRYKSTDTSLLGTLSDGTVYKYSRGGLVKKSDTSRSGIVATYWYIDSLFSSVGSHASLVKYTDTAAMLSPYLRKVDTTNRFIKSVTGTYPISSAGGQNPTITLDTASGKWRSEAYNNTKFTPLTRTISTTSPLGGGGDLSANRILTIADASADGATKGAATFTASDFNSSSGNISIDYTNGQSASGSNKGFLTSADWTTFNNKPTGSGTADRIPYWSTTSNLASTSIRADATRAAVGGAVDASYLFKVAGTFNATGNSQFNANISTLSGSIIDFVGGAALTIGGNAGTGALLINTSVAGGYYPAFGNAGTEYLAFKNAGSSFIRGNLTSVFFVLHSGLFGGTPVSGAIEFNGSNHYITNSTTTRAIVQGNRTQTSGAATLTLAITYSHYVFTGTTTTWTLPAISGNTDIRFSIKNRGSGAITLNSAAAGNDIYTTSAVNTMTINAGESYILHNDGTYWNVE